MWHLNMKYKRTIENLALLNQGLKKLWNFMCITFGKIWKSEGWHLHEIAHIPIVIALTTFKV